LVDRPTEKGPRRDQEGGPENIAGAKEERIREENDANSELPTIPPSGGDVGKARGKGT